MLVYQVLYLVNKNPFFSPWLHILGLEVIRAPVGDQVGCFNPSRLLVFRCQPERGALFTSDW